MNGEKRRSPVLELPGRLESALINGHPWVFKEHVPRNFRAKTGAWVRIRCGKFEGVALWDSDSPIALRVFSRGATIDAQWWAARLRDAWQLRKSVRDSDTDAFRWLHGEADSVPGIVVDHYAGFAVIACDGVAAQGLVPSVEGALCDYSLRGVSVREREAGPDGKLRHLSGERPPEDLFVTEAGLRFRADLRRGQKTGLFLDQRENRRRIAAHCEGLRVLNLFSYNGGFSVHAASGGAAHVVSVDSSPGAAADAEENFHLNGLDSGRHEIVVADVFEYLEKVRVDNRRFDVVICDPPSFARNQAQLKKALNAYTRVNAAAMKVVAPGGLFAASSCTARVTPKAFLEVLSLAARRAQRRYQIIEDVGHGADHPVLPSHPEGRYLKFVLGRLTVRP